MTAAPHHRTRRRLVALGIILAWLAAGLGLIHTRWFGRRLAAALEDVCERVTGEHVTVGDVELALWQRSLLVSGVVVQHQSARADLDGRTILAVEQIRLSVGLRA
ncbi:MAG: hypothetical protein GXP62_21775, partial [Oligoflexia bacterium]|nr:hypothetical protein [Oligoflexia bacterium]